MPAIVLKPTDSSHFRAFFEFESDPVAVEMAAFATLAKDFDAFSAMWQKRLENPDATAQTILLDDRVVGGLIAYNMDGNRCIGYWIDRNHWGKGIATEALKQFLEIETTRPLTAMCVADNIGSRLVLERNGFKYTHSEYPHAPARNEVVEEAFFTLG